MLGVHFASVVGRLERLERTYTAFGSASSGLGTWNLREETFPPRDSSVGTF